MEARRKELRQCGIVFRLQGPCEPAHGSYDVFSRLEKAAAPLVENGRAAAEALKLVATEWKAAGKNGREVYLLQQLRSFVEAAVARVSHTQVGELNIVDGGDGQAYASFVANFPAAVARVMAETAHAVGLDIRTLVGSKEVTR